jgi:hypothetical protein
MSLFERDLREIAAISKAARKDAVWIEAVLKNCWAQVGFDCSQLSFKPIEGKPYEKKLWEARYRKTSRSDGVHGYRLFYLLTRDPKSGEQVVVLLMVWGKEGDTTPPAVLDKAWKRYLEVDDLLKAGKFF